MPYPQLLDLIEYWSEWPPAAELLRGFVGYKPIPMEQRVARNTAHSSALRRQIGPDVEYEQLPKWLREMHAAQKRTDCGTLPEK